MLLLARAVGGPGALRTITAAEHLQRVVSGLGGRDRSLQLLANFDHRESRGRESRKAAPWSVTSAPFRGTLVPQETVEGTLPWSRSKGTTEPAAGGGKAALQPPCEGADL